MSSIIGVISLLIRYMKEDAMQRIKHSVYSNKEKYKNNKPWVADLFEKNNWFIESNIRINNFDLIIPDDNNVYDLNNVKILYDNMKNLQPYQANEERLWSYLTHVYLWDYMRKRWPVEKYYDKKKNKFENRMHEHYFLKSKTKRALIRNGISRLWWFGYVTYEENSSNSYALTEILLYTQDIAESVFGRHFSNNPQIVKSLLSVLKEKIDNGYDMPDRDTIRSLCKYLSHLGGAMIIDSLEVEELKNKLRKRLEFIESN